MILAGAQRLPKSVLTPKNNRPGSPLDVADHFSPASDMEGVYKGSELYHRKETRTPIIASVTISLHGVPSLPGALGDVAISY